MKNNTVNKRERLNIRFYIQPKYYLYNRPVMQEYVNVIETNIPIEEKEKVKDFLNLYIPLFLEGKYICKYDYLKPKDDECDLVISIVTDKSSKEIGAIFERLKNMMSQVREYLLYLKSNNIQYHPRAIGYYLRLRKTGRWINKDESIRKLVLRMDVDGLKPIIEKYAKHIANHADISVRQRHQQRLDVLTYICNDTEAYKRISEEKYMVETETKKSNGVKFVNPSSLIRLILKINLGYIGPYSTQYCEYDTVHHSYKDIELYFYNEDKDWSESLQATGVKEKLNEMITNCFKTSLRKHLEDYSELYNYNELISSSITYHSLKKASGLEINNGVINVDIKYKYQRNPDILVREDDAISNLLYSFIRLIRNSEHSLLDIREFTEWFNKRSK